MSSARSRCVERPLNQAVRIALLSMMLAGAAVTSVNVNAATTLDAVAAKPYNIAAGPLGRNLSSFAVQAGIALSFDPALTEGLNSPALSGSYSAREAVAKLLTGSGLDIVSRADGSYTLTKKSADAPRESSALPEVLVTAAALDGTTEGTGLYTSGATSTATRMNLSIRETPQSVSVMTRQRMDDQGLTQLSDVVTQTPGLTINYAGNMGSDSSTIYARGFAVENYQVDGVGQIYSNYSSIFQTSDMVLYDRVEVVRGATGLMNGVGSPSATINLVRKRPTKTFQASAKVEVGSWNYRRVEGDISTPLNEAGTVRGRMIAAVQDNDSYIDRLEEKTRIFAGIVEADIGPSTLATVGFTLQQQDATGHARSGLPAYYSDGSRAIWSRSDSAAASWAYSKRENQSIFASLEHRFDNEWLLKGTFNHASSEYDEVLGYAAGGYPVRATGAGVNLWAGRWAGKPVQDSLDVYATGPFNLFGRKHELVVGATSTRTVDDTVGYGLWSFAGWSSAVPNIYTWDGTSPAAPDNPARSDISMTERTNSAYSSVRLKPTDALSVILGARVTTWKNDKSTRTYATNAVVNTSREEKNQVTPYAGVVYDINQNWSTYASYTDIFKPQSNKDINGEYIDPLLGNSYEIGAKGEFFNKRLNVAAAIYKIKQDNLAVLIVPNIPLSGGGNAYDVVSGTSTKGVELEVGGEVARNWQASVAFARNMTLDRTGKALNTNVPRNTFKLFTSYRLPVLDNNLTVGGGVRWQDEIYSENQGPSSVRFTQESYAVVDLMARYQISKDLTATVNLYNAFDKSYYTSTGGSYYGAPRSLRVGVDMRF